jgi:hypothetical protein
VACCAPDILKKVDWSDADMNRRDVCMCFCCLAFPAFVSGQLPTHMPIGMGKLKSLRTLGLVNIAVNKSILRDLKMLAQLRKALFRLQVFITVGTFCYCSTFVCI